MPLEESDVGEVLPSGPPPPLAGFAKLAVWLETGYAGGRIAGWVPDVPGVLAVADTRERALSLALTATARVRDWLEAHGDDAGIPRLWGGQAAGEIAVERRPDGREVNVTLPADRRPVTQDEAAAAVRRIGWARADLLEVADRIALLEAATGPLESRVERGERPPREVLRHLAVAAARYISRVPGSGRVDADLDGMEARAAVVAAFDWSTERIATLGLADDGAETADQHGETWTLAKVVRRFLSHAFDHGWELERRLARADGTAERIRIGLDRAPTTAEVVSLLRSVGWDLRASEPASLEKALAGTTEFATAWDGGRLVGTARSISDRAQNAMIGTVVVHPAYQGLGIGERMVHLLIDGHPLIRFSLASAPGLEPWYAKLGFLPDRHAMFRPRNRS